MAAETSTIVLQSLVTLAAGGTGTAVVTGLLSRRKTKVEAEKTQAETGRTQAEIVGTGAKTSAEQVDTSLDLVREMRQDMTTLRGKVDELEKWKSGHERRMDAHVRWDGKVWDVLQRAGIDIDPPPPLRAPD